MSTIRTKQNQYHTWNCKDDKEEVVHLKKSSLLLDDDLYEDSIGNHASQTCV